MMDQTKQRWEHRNFASVYCIHILGDMYTMFDGMRLNGVILLPTYLAAFFRACHVASLAVVQGNHNHNKPFTGRGEEQHQPSPGSRALAIMA